MTASDGKSTATFRSLHAPGGILVLPNAWDAGSAALIEACGARAIATTSAAVAWSHGYPDGQHLPREVLLQTVSEIVRIVNVPVSVDSEAGFSSAPAEVAALVCKLVDLGVAGVNLEDGNDPPELLAAKIEAVKNAVSRANADIFVNARTDVLLKSLVPREQSVDEILARAGRYTRAGADGLFVPLLAEPDTIRWVTREVSLPVNVMAIPKLPVVADLRGLGVRRVSAGGAVGRFALASAQAVVERFLGSGESDAMFSFHGKPRDMNALLKRG
jgi:2-methylisocitrate lyase-like PEP mutase family enzyme